MNETASSQAKRAQKTRVFLVDDHEIFRTGLRTVLLYASDIDVTGESSADQGLLDRIEAAAPDIVLLGVEPGISNTIGEVKNRFPGVKILALDATDARLPPELIQKLDGYIKKEVTSEFLRAAIKMIALGGVVWHPNLIENCVDVNSGSAIKSDAQGNRSQNVQLSPRETRLLSLLVAGKTNKQISQELKLAQVTVKKALQVLFTKIGASNRTQAAIKASQPGLLTR